MPLRKFLRIVLHRVFGVPTYSVYEDDDPVAQRVGPALVGYQPKPGSREEMAASPGLFFVKKPKRSKSDAYLAICLVRDGPDAVVSLDVDNGQPLATDSLTRLKLYQEKKPFHFATPQY